MKKLLLILFIVPFLSCNKNDSDAPTPIPCTIELFKQQFGYSWHLCAFSYTDINGVTYVNSQQDDQKIENVDWSKPFSVMASAGVTTYNPGPPPITTYLNQVCNYTLKKDGVVIDVRSTSNYTYSN